MIGQNVMLPRLAEIMKNAVKKAVQVWIVVKIRSAARMMVPWNAAKMANAQKKAIMVKTVAKKKMLQKRANNDLVTF